MSRRIDPNLKEGRRAVKTWADAMRPIAQRHPPAEDHFHGSDGRIEESYSESGLRVQFTNLETFDMWAGYNSVSERATEFVYVRTVAPFKRDDENVTLAARIIDPIAEAARAYGFRAGIVTPNKLIGSCQTPAVSFGGESSANKFADYLRLVEMSEVLVDSFLLNAEKDRRRPYKYVVVNYPNDERFGAIASLKGVGDLTSALGILETSEPLNLSGPISTAYPTPQKSVSEFEKNFKAQYGKFRTVDEFLKRG